jgi:multidrug resistance efflux pump
MSRQDLQSTIVNRDSLEADVASAKAALELAQIDLQNTRIVPDGGQLGQISVRLGAYVTAGTHLTSLVPPQHWVIANLKETQLAEVRVGQPVTFTVDALNGEKFTARCRASPRRPAWSSAPFRRTTPPATLSKSPSAFRCASRLTTGRRTARLRPGMSVQVTIDTRAEKQQ